MVVLLLLLLGMMLATMDQLRLVLQLQLHLCCLQLLLTQSQLQHLQNETAKHGPRREYTQMHDAECALDIMNIYDRAHLNNYAKSYYHTDAHTHVPLGRTMASVY